MSRPFPAEFRYQENQDTPKARRLRYAFRKVFGTEPDLPPEVLAKIGADYFRADPVAERFVDEVYLGRGAAQGRLMLETALTGGVDSIPDAPESLKALFREIEQKPAWYDREAVELGARAFRRYGSVMFSFLGAATLEGYSENSVAKPLALTGAYAGDTAMQRFLETAAFWIDVSEPGGLDAGGAGIKTALRVRMMHVFVRRRLLAHPEWKFEDWGMPISLADALTTLMAGSYAPAQALRLLGYRPTDREVDAMMLFWRYTGFLMGVQTSWYPENRIDAARYMYYVMTKGASAAGEDGVNLCRSYVDAFAPRRTHGKSLMQRLGEQLEYRKQLGYVGLFVTPATRKYNGLPSTGLWGPLLAARFPVVFLWETLRRHVTALDDFHDNLARAERKRWLKRHLGERKTEYTAVNNFSR